MGRGIKGGVLRLLAAAGLIAAGMSAAPASATTTAPIASQPQVYVSGVAAPKTLSAGGKVYGAFQLVNNGAESVSDIYYAIILGGDYKNGQPQTIYDDKTVGGPISIAAKGQKVVNFTYTLPETVSGNVGLRIQAMLKGGYRMGWNDAYIAVKKTASTTEPIKVVYTSVSVNGIKFNAEMGPTIKNGEVAYYTTTLKNPDTKAVTLTPSISIYNRTLIGTPLTSYNDADITLAAGQQKDFIFKLPTFDYKPGVYAGRIQFIDGNKVARSAATFRYIIGGDIATILSVKTDTTTAAKNDAVTVTTEYAGSPYNILTGETHDTGAADLSVIVFNEKGETIGKGTAPVTLAPGNTDSPKKITVSASAPASGIVIEATIIKDGKVLSTYTTQLLETAASETESAGGISKRIWIIFAILALLITAVAASFIAIVLKGRKQPPFDYPTYGTFIFALLIAAGVLLGGRSASAFVETGRINDQSTVFSQIMACDTNGNNCTAQSSLTAGQVFYVGIIAQILTCTNWPEDVYIDVTHGGVTRTHYFRPPHAMRNCWDGNDVCPGYDPNVEYNHVLTAYTSGQAVIGPFTAPATAGTYDPADPATNAYKVDIKIHHVDNYENEAGTYKEVSGYETLTVTPPPVIQSCADATMTVNDGTSGDVQEVTITRGQSVTLKWKASNYNQVDKEFNPHPMNYPPTDPMYQYYDPSRNMYYSVPPNPWRTPVNTCWRDPDPINDVFCNGQVAPNNIDMGTRTVSPGYTTTYSLQCHKSNDPASVVTKTATVHMANEICDIHLDGKDDVWLTPSQSASTGATLTWNAANYINEEKLTDPFDFAAPPWVPPNPWKFSPSSDVGSAVVHPTVTTTYSIACRYQPDTMNRVEKTVTLHVGASPSPTPTPTPSPTPTPTPAPSPITVNVTLLKQDNTLIANTDVGTLAFSSGATALGTNNQAANPRSLANIPANTSSITVTPSGVLPAGSTIISAGYSFGAASVGLSPVSNPPSYTVTVPPGAAVVNIVLKYNIGTVKTIPVKVTFYDKNGNVLPDAEAGTSVDLRYNMTSVGNLQGSPTANNRVFTNVPITSTPLNINPSGMSAAVLGGGACFDTGSMLCTPNFLSPFTTGTSGSTGTVIPISSSAEAMHIGVKYDINPPVAIECKAEYLNDPGKYLSTAEVNRPVRWKITQGADSTKTYTWSGTEIDGSISGPGMISIIKSYPTLGTKTVRVEDNSGRTANCVPLMFETTKTTTYIEQ